MPAESTRGYRSHLQPACLSCRRRKSRCHSDAANEPCLMCRAHSTDCIYPPHPRALAASRDSFGRRNRHQRSVPASSSTTSRPPEVPGSSTSRQSIGQRLRHDHGQITTPEKSDSRRHTTVLTSALNSPDDRQSNLHIVGPTVTADNQVLSDYLSGVPGATQSPGVVGPVPASRSRAVLFTRVNKRPLGTIVDLSPAAQKLETIEKIIDPFNSTLIDV